MGRMFTFYASLPKELPGFYIRGYSEALRFVRGVRVIPDASYIRYVPPEFQYHFNVVDPRTNQGLTYPAYYIPIKVGPLHYGFVLKSPSSKLTPGESWWSGFKMVGLEALDDPRPYIVVTEGIKDSFLFWRHGLPAAAALTSTVSTAFLLEAKARKKWILYAGDNDEAGHANFDPDKPSSLLHRAAREKVEVVPFFPTLGKDWGEIFDHGVSKDGIEARLQEFRSVYTILEQRGTK